MQFIDYLLRRWPEILNLAVEHITLVLIAVAIAALIAVALGVAVYRNEIAATLVVAVAATILTVPSLALFAFMVAYLGLGSTPAIIALVLYALLPIVRNTVTGLQAIDPAITESAKGMGLNARQRLLRIDLPLAWPVIITGIRVSTMLLVSIAAIASYVGAGGLGDHIFAGLARRGGANAVELLLGGTLGVVLVAFLLDLAYQIVGRLTTPKGIR